MMEYIDNNPEQDYAYNDYENQEVQVSNEHSDDYLNEYSYSTSQFGFELLKDKAIINAIAGFVIVFILLSYVPKMMNLWERKNILIIAGIVAVVLFAVNKISEKA